MTSEPPPTPHQAARSNRGARTISARLGQNNRALSTVVGLLLIVAMVRSNVVSHQTRYALTSRRYELLSTALESTKEAFATSYSRMPGGRNGTIERNATAELAAGRATRAWLVAAESPAGTAGDWRRVGLVRHLFGRSGVLAAFRYAATMATRTVTAGNTGVTALDHRSAAPAGEWAMWQAIYGPAALPTERVPEYRSILTRLDLGWFAQIALGDLYERAGLKEQAQRAYNAAFASAEVLTYLSQGYADVALAGLIALAILAPCVVVRGLRRQSRLHKARSPNAAGAASPTDASLRRTRQTTLRYDALAASFAAYLLLPVLAWPLFTEVHRYISGYSAVNAARFMIGLNAAVTTCIGATAVSVLVWLSRASGEAGNRVSARGVVAAVGLRSAAPLRGIGWGMLGYAVLAPILLGISTLSHGLFGRFDTPVNPVDTWIALLQTPVDRLAAVVAIPLIAGVVEETMFRGILYNAVRQRYGVWAGIVISGAIFGLLHPTLPRDLLPIWFLGVAFACAYEWSGSLLPAIVMHFVQDAFALSVTLAVFAR